MERSVSSIYQKANRLFLHKVVLTSQGYTLKDTQNIASVNKRLSPSVQTIGEMFNGLSQVIKPSKLNCDSPEL